MEEETKVEKEERTGRVYELAYNMVSTIAPEAVAGEVQTLKDAITKLGGTVISDEMAKEIELAYPMVKTISNKKEKFNRAYFGWIKFEMEAQDVLKLKA